MPIRDSSLPLLRSPMSLRRSGCAPALWQVLEAMLAESALESPSVLVLAFHSSLFIVRGSSDEPQSRSEEPERQPMKGDQLDRDPRTTRNYADSVRTQENGRTIALQKKNLKD